MDMGHSSSTGSACQISMLWNWNTIDSCFLSKTWHVRTKGMFAGSVIGVFCLVIAIEAVRRFGREYDSRLMLDARAKAERSDVKTFVFTPSWPQQALRSLVYGSQFTAAFLVMLLGMYYNGYILFAIFIGQTVGYFIFGKDTCRIDEGAACGSGSCC